MLAKNPVIYSDYPDPDVIRVGDTYYLVTTTMHFFPGAQILSSRDMVNWQHVGYVYDRFGETDAQKMLGGAIYGQGMWAPVLRYHQGVFHVVFCCNDTKKCYHYTATDIHGPWKKGYIEGFLKAHNLKKYISDHLCYGDTLLTKGENNRIVAERNGFQHPVYVGDTQGDLQSAMDAGMPFVFCEYGFGSVSHYDAKVETFSELNGLF